MKGLFVIMGLWLAAGLSAHPLDNWHIRYPAQPAPPPLPLHGITFFDGKFVAVGDQGSIFASQDPINWQSRRSGTTGPLYAVASGPETIVAVGEAGDSASGGVLTVSTNGLEWVVHRVGSPLNSITWGNGLFTAVGNNGAVFTSTDGSTWTKRNSGTAKNLFWIAYGNGAFVALDNSGTLTRSVDGIAWNSSTNGPVVTASVYARVSPLAFGGNKFVVASRESWAVSSDGVEWEQTSVSTFSNSPEVSLTFQNGEFLALSGGGLAKFSPDLRCGNVAHTGQAGLVSAATYGDGVYLAVGNMLAWSRDGQRWASLPALECGSGNCLYGDIWLPTIAFGSGKFLAPGRFSTNGAKWFETGVPWETWSAPRLHAVEGVFAALGEAYNPQTADFSTALFSSTNGFSWTRRGFISGSGWADVAYGNSRWVAVAGNGGILDRAAVSLDGHTWSETALPTEGAGWAIAFGNGTFVTVGRGDIWQGTILSSTNGADWVIRRQSASEGLINVVFANSLFIAVGQSANSGVILTSPDGVTWTRRTSGVNYAIVDATWGGGLYAAVGGIGEVLTSSDAVAWTRRKIGVNLALGNIAFGVDSFIVTAPGAILQSDPLTDGSAHFVERPEPRLLETGSDALMTAVVTGMSPLNYQWLSNNIALPEATNSSLWIPDWKQDQDTAARFHLRVSNQFGSVQTQAEAFSTPDPFGHWDRRLSLGGQGGLADVVYINGMFVAVGAHGTIVTSADGLEWITRQSGTLSDLTSIAYGQGILVAVGSSEFAQNGDSPPVFVSPDGVHWERQNICANGGLRSVTFGGDLFVAVGDSSVIFTSSDGRNWTPQPTAPNYYLRSVAFGNGRFVAVGGTNSPQAQQIILTSSDGTHWTQAAWTGLGDLTKVVFGNGIFVAGPYDPFVVSRDGITWSRSDPKVNIVLPGPYFANGLFTTWRDNGTAVTNLTSTAGTNWTSRSAGGFSPVNAVPTALAYGAGVYVGVGSSESGAAFVATSSDLLRWEERSIDSVPPELRGLDLQDIVYGNGTYVAYAGEVIATSGDGVSWRTERIPEGTLESARSGSAMAFGNGVFLALSQIEERTVVLKSVDGLAWNTLEPSALLHSVSFGNSTFVAVGPEGIYGSTDGSKWSLREARQTDSYDTTLSFAAGRFFANGPDGTVLVSTNGITWNFLPPFSNMSLQEAAASEQTIVVGGGSLWTSSFAFTSIDGVNWNRSVIFGNAGEYVRRLTYGNGKFVATNWRGAFSSADGLQWNALNLPIKVNSVRFLNGSFWAVGPGVILQATAGSVVKFEISTLQRFAGGTFQAVLIRPRGAEIFIEASSDLQTWFEIPLVEKEEDVIEFTDNEGIGYRFYRAGTR